MTTIPAEDLEIGVWPPVVRTGMMTNGPGPRGIYIKHKPTGIGTICDCERSQFANKQRALKMLESLLTKLGWQGTVDSPIEQDVKIGNKEQDQKEEVV